MGLVPCRGCGVPVSVEAAACPRCGQPTMVGKQAQGRTIALVIVVVVALASVGMMFNACAR